jgi:serine/threonine-protein kinase HipA
MLASMGWDCPGAVQFCRPGDISLLVSRTGDHVEVSEADLARRLRDLRQDPASWTMPAEHWSLGGQQEKFALARIGGRWNEAHGAAPTTHIIKPGIRHLQNQALVEHVTMSAAAALGLDIAASMFVRFEDEWAIAVERFDRYAIDGGEIGRLHQEDFCQALGRMPSAKYEQRGGPTLGDMVRVIRQESTRQESDILALADFLIINVVAGAPDGHSKNISILRSAGNTWIAPLYDLATGLLYDSRDVDRSVAVSVGGERSVARIRQRQWDKAANTLGLPVDLLTARVSHLARDFPKAFDSAVHSSISVPGAEAILDRASKNLTPHCERIVAQLG